MTWYRPSRADHDTHRGTLTQDSVDAACGIRDLRTSQARVSSAG